MGTLGDMMTTPRPLSERLWPKVEPEPNTGCWLWMGGANNKGYGMLHDEAGKHMLSHRASYMLTNGPIPQGMHVLHRCDTPLCCNPAHLFLGTHTDNMRDAASKGRIRGPWSTKDPTRCKHGHLYDTTYPNGHPRCKTCMRAAAARYEARQRTTA
jgi:hypothetical protein